MRSCNCVGADIKWWVVKYNPLAVPASAVVIESRYAVQAAGRYLELVEEQLGKAEVAKNEAALKALKRLANWDEADYEEYVGSVQKAFEEDYQPILRYTGVVFVYM